MKLYLPKSLEDELVSLTDREEEIQGVLICAGKPFRPETLESFAAAYKILGVGGAGSVKTDENAKNVVDYFLITNPRYGFVLFHTHSRGTVKLDDEWAHKFSLADLESIEKKKEIYGLHYFELLFTPRMILYSGDDESFEIVNSDWVDDDCRPWELIREEINRVLD
jgi:hypothetical protein